MKRDPKNYIYHDEAKDLLLLEYEEILCGNKKSFSTYLFTESRSRNQDVALCAFRYLFHNIFCWDFEQAKANLSLGLIKNYKLDKLLSTRIVFPDSPTDKYRKDNGDFLAMDKAYLLHLIYPEYKYDIEESTIATFKDVLSGKSNKFPKGFWNEHDGRLRAIFCLRYVLNEMPTFPDLRHAYEFFASREAMDIIRKYKLNHAVNLAFEGDPLYYFHESLSSKQADEMLYQEFRDIRAETWRPKSKQAYNPAEEPTDEELSEATDEAIEAIFKLLQEIESKKEEAPCAES